MHDSAAQKDAEIVLEDEDPYIIDSAKIYHTPGHTKGHMVLLWQNRYLFTGDHFAWMQRIKKFGSFRNACWYSWEKQIESVRKMAAFEKVKWVFPGHGKWGKVEHDRFPIIIQEAVAWMEDAL